ncbi:hypothetical protein ACHQM5_016298 [Ranunculus cassubicifolius]
MSPSFDCALLCAEDNESLMCFDDSSDYGNINDDFHQPKSRSFFDNVDSFFMGLSLHSEDSISLMVEKESQHLPRNDYFERLLCGDLDLNLRREAVDWILKVHAYYSFGPLSAYLSINYLDRFLSAYELPKGKAWMMQLLAVACLSIAAKMEETEVPLSLDLQVCEAKFVFESRTIQRMELLVLSTLNWRMQAIMPFSFMDYFLCKFNNDQPPLRLLISRSVELILGTLEGIEYLKFRPSEIAVAVAISVLGELQIIDIDNAAPYFIQFVQKERVLKCMELIHGVSLTNGSSKGTQNSGPVSSVPQSPIGVLDAAACLSYKSDELTVGSCANSSHSSPEAKRRKLNPSSEMELKS